MSGFVPLGGARLTLQWIGVASCARVALVTGAASGIVTFLGAFILWQVVTPALDQTVGSALAGSGPLLAGLLGPGTGLAVAAVLGLVAAVLVLLAGVVVPLFYRAAAARMSGVGLVLAAGE